MTAGVNGGGHLGQPLALGGAKLGHDDGAWSEFKGEGARQQKGRISAGGDDDFVSIDFTASVSGEHDVIGRCAERLDGFVDNGCSLLLGDNGLSGDQLTWVNIARAVLLMQDG